MGIRDRYRPGIYRSSKRLSCHPDHAGYHERDVYKRQVFLSGDRVDRLPHIWCDSFGGGDGHIHDRKMCIRDRSGSGLCTENSGDGAFRKLAGFDLQIFVDQVEHVQLLTFVLVQTFNLDIVDGVVVDLDALSGQDVVFQDFLVGLFDLQKLA